MGIERFDDLTKTLATGTSRRLVLKALGGVVAAGVLALFGPRRTEALPKKKTRCAQQGEACGSDEQCCGSLVCRGNVCTKAKKT